jgi:hypothetical protein
MQVLRLALRFAPDSLRMTGSVYIEISESADKRQDLRFPQNRFMVISL